MKKLVSVLVLASAVTLVPALATAGEYWSNDSWAVFDNSDDDGVSCSLETVDDSNSGGNLYSGLALLGSGNVIAYFKNYAWSIKAGEEITGMSLFVQYENQDRSESYSGGEWRRVDQYTFAVGVSETILDHYSQAKRLAVFRDRGDGEPDVIVGIVSLSGSSVGIRKLKECVSAADARTRREAERERTRPTNPF